MHFAFNHIIYKNNNYRLYKVEDIPKTRKFLVINMIQYYASKTYKLNIKSKHYF